MPEYDTPAFHALLAEAKKFVLDIVDQDDKAAEQGLPTLLDRKTKSVLHVPYGAMKPGQDDNLSEDARAALLNCKAGANVYTDAKGERQVFLLLS